MIAYATYYEIKEALADSLPVTVTTHDNLLRAWADRASRLIDRLTGRTFWPAYATRYPRSDGGQVLDVGGDLLAISSVTVSIDDGENYSSALSSSTDYYARGGDNLDFDDTPIYQLELNINARGGYTHWYTGQRAVKIVGWWGWHDDYANAWEDSQDEVEDAALTAAATTITVNDADGADAWGKTPRFQAGQLLRIETEYVLVTTVTAGSTNTLTVRRGQCGTTAATHAQNTDIYIYRPPQIVRAATIAQAVRWWKRGTQAFQDVSALAELGQLTYAQKIDPDIVAVLYDAGLRRVVV